jgi:hypothetical protein
MFQVVQPLPFSETSVFLVLVVVQEVKLTLLVDFELQHTSFSCFSAPGRAGAPGNPGAAGFRGQPGNMVRCTSNDANQLHCLFFVV